MIYPVCKKEKKKSKVFVGVLLRTSMANIPFYDEKGRLHNHNDNITTTSYECSNNHKFEIKTKTVCPTCGHNKDFEEIIIKE